MKNKGIQFYHFEGYSRIESKSQAKKGKSIYSIAGEAERTKGYCDHVEEPKKPVLLYGVSFSDVVKISENYAENTFDSLGRAVRKNGLCAIFGVVSAPPDMAEKVWTEYKKLIIEFLKETWGANLKSIIEHIDEYFEPDPENGIKKNVIITCILPSSLLLVSILRKFIRALRQNEQQIMLMELRKNRRNLMIRVLRYSKKKGDRPGIGHTKMQ